MSFTLASLASLRVLVGVVGAGYALYSNRIGGQESNKNDWDFAKVPEAIFGEFVGGLFADWARGAAVDWRKVKDIQPDELNHDLQRAARKAQLMATFFACQSCLANLKHDRSGYLQRLKNVVVNDEDIRWLNAVSKNLKAEIAGLPTAKFKKRLDYQDVFNIFDRNKIINSEKSAQEFADKLNQQNLSEVRNTFYSKFGNQIAIPFSPDGYNLLEEAILNGWDEIEVDTNELVFINIGAAKIQSGRKYDWFHLVCILFNEEFRNNQKIQAAIQKREMLEIRSLKWTHRTGHDYTAGSCRRAVAL